MSENFIYFHDPLHESEIISCLSLYNIDTFNFYLCLFIIRIVMCPGCEIKLAVSRSHGKPNQTEKLSEGGIVPHIFLLESEHILWHISESTAFGSFNRETN
ncbi:hypothetical protein HZS_3386 [Henneguya salminicola]|nr:hypothetical protein HZS_3386 [Henneguya salminicola]